MKSIYANVSSLPKVGPKRAMALSTLGITTIEDLLTYYPFRYDDLQERALAEIDDQAKVLLKGIVVSPAVVSHYGYKKSRLNFRMKVDDAVIAVTFFNQSFLKDKIVLDEEIAIFGKWNAQRKTLTGMKIVATQAQGDDFTPIYHVNKEIKQATLVNLIKLALDEYGAVIPEILPTELMAKYQLMDRGEAIYQMHFPESLMKREAAKRRLAYEEFFLFEMNMQGLKYQDQQLEGNKLLYDNQQLKAFIQTLPFEMTGAQKRVINEICRDLRSPQPMNRLLQGDVGSGKTVVAAVCLYAAILAGYQGALMVPTEILAEQHFQSMTSLFQETDVKLVLLTGSTPTSQRKVILEQLKNGEIDLVIGTHALIQKEVEFAYLGFGIIDEQHRFGVNQRQALRHKGHQIDLLSMTATPIPRTLAITAYGEMEVSVIDELPQGRKPIETRWVKMGQFDQVLDWCQKELASGSQMYVICPLIAESEALDAKNAEETYQHLQAYYPQFKVGLLHGKMKADEKDQLMTAFEENDLQILVSTTVVEVGVNVPNATMMLVMNADRFGLAQLHQLRGRVGRGTKASQCILLADPKNEVGEERMKIMTETNDGFVLSQRDLEMRGPGEFFGQKQSGLPEFKVANLVEDETILAVATSDALSLWQNAWEEKEEYLPLRYYLEQHQFRHPFD